MKKPIYLHCSNHFDPIWRRGFKKEFAYNRERFVSNGDIQLACIDEWVEMSKHEELKFEVECSLVLRYYLERRPEHLETLKRLQAEGRFELLAAGELIPDPNMPIGETLIRNLLYGLVWAEDTLGELPTTGCVNDGFGSSAQMPQIFRGFGIKWLTGLSYKFPTKDYWRGLDGTPIYIHQDYRTKNAKYLSRPSYYRPCPHCAGGGCEACLQRGFDHSYRMGMEGEVDDSKLEMNNYPLGWIEAGGEENLVVTDLVERVRRVNEEQEQFSYEFILLKQLAERYSEDIEAVDNPDPARVSPEVDGNPVSSGCLVSRIKVKQEMRRLENRLEAVEKWAALSGLNGGAYPAEQLAEAWRGIVFASFHDSVTGTHIDVGYEELMENYESVGRLIDDAERQLAQNLLVREDGTVSVFNPNSYAVSQPVTARLPLAGAFRLLDENGEEAVIYSSREADGTTEIVFLAKNAEPLSWGRYKAEAIRTEQTAAFAEPDGLGLHEALVAEELEPEAKLRAEATPLTEAVIENEFFRVRTNDRGLTSIWDKRSGQELVSSGKGYANELVLEHDVGDPWTTRELERPRLRLGDSTRLVAVEKNEHQSVLIYKGKLAGNEDVTHPIDYRVLVLEWEQRVIVRNGVARIDFETDIDWDSFDRRIRVSFPTPHASKRDPGHYAVPYGTLTRERYEMSFTGWENANGDWPAVEWASTAAPIGSNVAIFNRGTPSYRIERGEILMSVLRSPTFPNCLHWPKEYNAPVYDGMRDSGKHSFSYALYSYEGSWQDSEVVREAYAFNKPLLAYGGMAAPELDGISLEAESTLISAIKQAERGNDIVLRLFQHNGRSEEALLRVPARATAVYETNMLERDGQRLDIGEDGIVRIPMTPFKIATIRISATS